MSAAMSYRSRRAASGLMRASLLAVTLAACAPETAIPPAALAEPAAPPQAFYRRAEASGQTVWRIDPQRSLISVTVRRDGALARLGHDHVVASHDVAGWVAPGMHQADLYFRLDQLRVDEAPLRRAAGLDTQPSDDAIDGTRRNMLTRALDAERFPLVLMHVAQAAAGRPFEVRITLHGVTRTMTIPVASTPLDGDAGAGIIASGAVSLKQSDFGIAPFAVLGGALAVKDRLEVRFRLVAQRASAPG